MPRNIKEELISLVDAARHGDLAAHENFLKTCFEESENPDLERKFIEQLPHLPFPDNEDLCINQATALDHFGLHSDAAACMASAADSGSWRAAFQVGLWKMQNPNYANIPIDGLGYLEMSGGPGHNEGMYFFHMYSQKSQKSPLRKVYHYFAAFYYAPNAIRRWDRLGS